MSAEAKEKSWLEKQREIHGETVVPDTFLNEKLNREESENVIKVFGDLLGAPKRYTIGDRTFLIEEPTIGQIKRRLLPILRNINPNANPEAILAQLNGLEEFQALIGDCITFEEGTAPENVVEWMDSLKATPGLELAEAFAESIDWAGIIERAVSLQGKIRGVRGKAQPKS